MAVSLRASKQGLALVDLARRKKGWTKTAATWCGAALVGEAALRKFWRRIPITQENFVRICKAVELDNWEEIVDLTQPKEANQTSEFRWLLELRATIEEVDKPLIDDLVLHIQQCSPNAFVKTQKIDPGSTVLVEEWQPVESVLPRSRTRSRAADAQVPEGSIKRAKEINLGAGQVVALVVQRTPEAEEEVGVSIWVYPADDAIHLPPGLQVMALDESEAIIVEEQAGSADDSIKLEFGIEPEELFSIKVILGDVTISEDL